MTAGRSELRGGVGWQLFRMLVLELALPAEQTALSALHDLNDGIFDDVTLGSVELAWQITSEVYIE